MSRSRPDVVHILPVPGPLRGTERNVLDLLLGEPLAGLDQRVAFLRGSPGPEWPTERVLSGPRVLGPLGTLIVVARAAPRIAHGWLLWGNLAAALVKVVRPSVSVVTTEQNIGHALSPLRRLLERVVANREDVATANCEAVRAAAVARLPGRTGSFVVIEGAARPLLRPDAIESGDCVTVARLEHVKDQASGLRAWARVVARRPGATLTLVGDGPLRAQLEELAHDLGIAQTVRFAGERDPAPFMFGARVFMLSSRAEGLPRSMLEAFAAGVPVVATAVGGIRDLPDDVLLRVPPGDAQALAGALVSLLEDAELRRRLAGAGSRLAAARYGLTRFQEDYLRLYEGLVA